MKKLILLLTLVALLLTLAACGARRDADVLPNLVSTGTEPDTEPAPTQASTEAQKEVWKVEFERGLMENYGVAPEYYEDLGDGIYQVYVKIDGKIVPYVTVNSATGDYHG